MNKGEKRSPHYGLGWKNRTY